MAEGRKGRPGSAALIARLRRIALALPGATEKLSHGEPTFFAGKCFVMVDNDHHGSGHVAIWCKAEPGVQAALVESEPRHFFVPPYVGKSGWVGVRLDSGLDWANVAAIVERGWREVVPRKLLGDAKPKAPVRRARRPARG
ncbi:MAG TPA: MmcQ/YjbR family DNA-binding protein [Vicinamibacterales bacterium]|nr:MmcQ/YjbR family DNA-binding protein [Vicinamibacterales bacterium]